MSDIDNILGGMDPALAKLIGEPPPPPPPSTVASSIDTVMSPKEARAAERAADRSADQFARDRINKQYLRKFGAIASAIPGAERIRIRKRLDSANLAYVGEYNFRDLASVVDIEAFVARYVKPKHGAGEYDVTIIDANGREFPAGSVFLVGDPVDGGGSSNMVDLVRDLMTAKQQPQVDPFEQMQKAQRFAEELKKSSGGGDATLMAMMAMMAQPKQTGPDPILLATLERLASKVEKIEQTTAAPPMPLGAPLPPPPPATDWVALGTQIVLPLLQMMQQQSQNNMQMLLQMTQNRDTLGAKDMIALMQESQSRAAQLAAADKLSVRDVIDLLQRKNEESKPQNSLEDQMEAFIKMREFAQAISPPPPPGSQGASFWDALVALASSGDVAAALSDRIRSRTEQQPVQHAAPQVTHRALPSTSGAQVVPFRPRNVPAQVPQTAAPAQGPAQQAVPLPPTLKDDCAKITMAGDPPARLQALVETLLNLYKTNEFKGFVEALLGAIAANETERTLHGLGRWLVMLEENSLLERKTSLAVLQDVKTHWDAIRELLLEKLPFLRNLANAAQGGATSSAPAPQAASEPAPAAAPAEIPASLATEDDVGLSEGYGEEVAAAPVG
ncbi:MAG: hypothetical protein ACRCSL_04695 [Microbacterium sp.]